MISLTLSRHPSILYIISVGLQGYILYRHRADVCKTCLCSSMWRDPLEYVTYEFISTSPAVSRMSASSNLDRFPNGWKLAIQQLLCGVLPPWLVQYYSQHSCVVAVKLLLIRLVSVHVVHSYRTAAWKKNCVLFHRPGLTSIWPIAYLWLSMPFLIACWCDTAS